MLTRVAQDAERALRALEQADGLLADTTVGDAHAPLGELIGRTSTSIPTACPTFTAAPPTTASCRSTTPRCATGVALPAF